jgi:hypothetical protein
MAKKAKQTPGNEECKGARAVTSEQRTPGSQILHSKTRRVKLHRTRIISCKTTNRKKVVNHRRGNKNIGKAKGAVSASGTHGRDRKTRTIYDHDGRRVKERGRVNG